AASQTLNISPAFDALGNDVLPTAANFAQDSVFCTHVRLTWLYGPPPNVKPPYLIRAEVRVFWLRDGGGGLPSGMPSICDPGNTPDVVEATTNNIPSLGRFHFVYATSAIGNN